MRVVLFALAGFAAFTFVLYAFAGRWVAVRARRAEHLTDRVLLRAHRRTVLLYCAVSFLAVVGVLATEPRIPRAAAIAAAWCGPILWLWALVAGASWLEIVARGIDVDLWRYHRFDVFATFLLVGQRLPFFSAAFTARADLHTGAEVLPSVIIHLAAAIAFGVAIRLVVTRLLVRTRDLPDGDLLADVRATAREAGVLFRRIRIVPTERGQSVNAIAATSSRTIFVAEGLVEGLDRHEVRAVLLHEAGHFAQPFANTFRNVAVLGWPAVVYGIRALPGLVPPAWVIPAAIGLLAAGVGGSVLAREVYRRSEVNADRFAARLSAPGDLASALRKLFERPPPPGLPSRRSHHRLTVVEERLRSLAPPSPPPPDVRAAR